MSSIHPIELKRRLRRLSRALNTQTRGDINWGGCGVMAGIVGEILELWGIPVEVVTPAEYDWGVPPKEARERLQAEYWGENWTAHDWDNNGLYRSHLAVRFVLGGKLHTWDSDGLLCSDKFFGRRECGEPSHVADYPFGEGMTVQECIEISSTPSGWNSTFDRRQIPLMRELAYQHLLP